MGKTAKSAKRGNTGAAADTGTDRLHLTSREVRKTHPCGNRNPERDRCLLLLAFRHGFRVSELCGLKLDQVDVESRIVHVRRLKRRLSTTHPLRADEIRAVTLWLKTRARMLRERVRFTW